MPNSPTSPVPACDDATTPTPAWRGTTRYEVVRCIGEGGMGVVYEAFDRERAQSVALKTLRNFNPAALYRFKQEFRTLADVTHSNLVRLYELVATAESGVFFTMELVSGVNFLAYTRREDHESQNAISVSGHNQTVDDDAPTLNEANRERMSWRSPESELLPPPNHQEVSAGRLCPADIDRLRSALIQLVEGVQALHTAGKLHRDIKPSNVLVTPAGRVVLLDFGVATELGSAVDEGLVEREVVGTVSYMAPEQTTDEAPGAASDWYSVGAMLYEALVGQRPFVGPRLDVVTRKMMLDPYPPRECAQGVPADLDALCCDLLRRDPRARPTGAQVLRRLGVGRGMRPHARPSPPAEPLAAVSLAGREVHLRALRDAFDDAKVRAVTVLVHGGSGMGKSALVEHFLDEIVERGEAVTLRGRAYERESVPYKAFDSVVDALSRYLMRVSDDSTVALPGDIWALARLFPVLRRVAPIAAALEPRVADAQYVRRHAFIALRGLLGALARRQPLVIWIDDVQWGDVDSVSLLFETVRPPVAPPILMVLTYRDEEAKSSPFILEMHARWPVPAEMRDLAVGPLAPEDARSLAVTLLSLERGAPVDTADAIARESGGNAFLIEELVRSVVARRQRGGLNALSADLGPVTLENMVGERLGRLGPSLRRLVEVVAVGGRPLEVSLAGDAAGIYEDVEDIIARLRTLGFVRTGFRAGRETVEMSHDGIRKTVLGRLTETALREHHGRLARVLESATTTDAEAIAVHLFGSGEDQRAAQYARRAAEEAIAKLAFDQAIRLYKLSIATVDGTTPAAREMRTRLGEVFEGAGRGVEASGAYLHAAEGAAPFERMELRRRAAGQLIQCGHIDEGIGMMRGVLEAVGMTMPRTAAGAVLCMLVYRVWFWLMGSRFKERGPDEVRPLDRARIDACHAVAVGLLFVDSIFANYMTSRHLVLALRDGDRFRVLRALAMHTVTVAAEGGQESSKERRFAETVRRLAERAPEPDAWVYVDIIRALCVFLHGRWKEVSGLDTDLLVALPHNRGGWRSQVRMTVIWSLVLVGKIAVVRRSIGNMIEDAENRGDLLTAVAMRVGYTNLCWLADDDPAEARRHLSIAAGMWLHSGFFLQNYRMTLAEANILLYESNEAAAYSHVISQWRAIQRSLILFVQYTRVDARYLRARVALASLETAPNRAMRLAEAARFAKALEREKMPWPVMLSEIIKACIRLSEGDRPGAIGHLRSAIDRADDVGMGLHGAAARYQLGTLVGGVEGRKLVEAAEDWMRGQDIRVPARFAAMLVPGKWSSPRT